MLVGFIPQRLPPRQLNIHLTGCDMDSEQSRPGGRAHHLPVMVIKPGHNNDAASPTPAAVVTPLLEVFRPPKKTQQIFVDPECKHMLPGSTKIC